MEFDVDGQVSLFILHIYSKAIETGKRRTFMGLTSID